MTTRSFSLPLRAVALSFASAQPVAAQCLEWSREFVRSDGLDDMVRAVAEFDDGSGPAIYAGGYFAFDGTVEIGGVAKRVGSSWVPLGPPLDGTVDALEVFDDGSGPALYVGGYFFNHEGASHIARWNGTSWSEVGDGVGGGGVHDMCVHDDGSGPALFAVGDFTGAGAYSATRIAKWNGSTWRPLGPGLTNGTCCGTVYAVASFNDGTGPALYAAGSFLISGSLSVNRIAKWKGGVWSGLGSGLLSGEAYALSVFDAGSGPALYVGGAISSAGGVPVSGIARWNGSGWSSLGSGVSGGRVYALEVFDDGAGPALHVGGDFGSAGGVSSDHIAKWDATGWTSFASGLSEPVRALAVFDDGSGPVLCAGGEFQSLTHVPGGSPSFAPRFSTWDGAAWTTDASRILGIDHDVRCMVVHDDGSGPSLFAGGTFEHAGTAGADRIARFDGTYWWSLESGMNNDCDALAVYDDGSGSALFASGVFWFAGGKVVRYIAKWDGAQWSDVGGGADYYVHALAVFDDGSGPALYAAGKFNEIGGVAAKSIAKWNGTSWSPVGNGLCSWVYALTVHDDGSGPALFAAGIITCAIGGPGVNRIAKWNGSAWSALGAGLGSSGSEVLTLASVDDGTGAALYAGGVFQNSGALVVNNVAKWNGTQWSALGTGVDAVVRSLVGHDDGSGPALYAGGRFSTASGLPASRIAKWNGSAWSPLGGGTSGYMVRALGVFDDGSANGPELYVGGRFDELGGQSAINFGRWGDCRPGTEYCFGDDLDPVVTADCPCSNFGDPGHGCANSNPALGGARLVASGSTSPNTVLLTCTNIVNNTLCTFLRGKNHDPAGAVFGDGIKCLNPPMFRFGAQISGQIGNPLFTVSVGTFTEIPGFTWYYTVQYRNPTPGFCNPGLFNASNGYSIAW